MKELMVEWQSDGGRLSGSSLSARKIIFPKRGEESGCCLKAGHFQKCQVVRDTQPDTARKGALIVTLMEECQHCKEEASTLALLGPGWNIDKDGVIIAPDGVSARWSGGRISPAGITTIKKEYKTRFLLRRAVEVCSGDDFLDQVKETPYPEGEPTIPAQPRWEEPKEWVILKDWVDSHKELVALAKTHATLLAVNHQGEFGWVYKTPTFEYLSNDERGTRIGGGELVFTPQTLENFQGFESWEVLQKEISPFLGDIADIGDSLNQAILNRDKAKTEFLAQEEARKQSIQSWWYWWVSLNDHQKVRVVIQGKYGACNLKPIISQRRLPGATFHQIAWTQNYPTFPFKVEERDGKLVFELGSTSLYIEMALAVSGLYHEYKIIE